MNIKRREAASPLKLAASARLAEAAVAAMTGVPAASLRHAHRRPVARARQTAMYLCHVAFGVTLTRVGLCFGRDRTTVRHACALVEDRRDDPAVDLGLSAIEAGIVALGGALAQEARR